MILFWNDVKSFNRHLENMRRFRQWHRKKEKCNWHIIKDMPMVHDIHVPISTGGARCFYDASNREMVVPLWNIKLPGSSQN